MLPALPAAPHEFRSRIQAGGAEAGSAALLKASDVHAGTVQVRCQVVQLPKAGCAHIKGAGAKDVLVPVPEGGCLARPPVCSQADHDAAAPLSGGAGIGTGLPWTMQNHCPGVLVRPAQERCVAAWHCSLELQSMMGSFCDVRGLWHMSHVVFGSERDLPPGGVLSRLRLRGRPRPR
jgi:hypothetical protein